MGFIYYKEEVGDDGCMFSTHSETLNYRRDFIKKYMFILMIHAQSGAIISFDKDRR